MYSPIAFDLDGVIFDLIKMFKQLYEKIYNEKLIYLPNRGSEAGRIEDVCDIPEERVIKIIDCYLDKHFKSSFVENSLEVLNKMFKNNDLNIITKRSEDSKEAIHDYLQKNLPDVSNINIYCSVDAFKYKLKYIRELGCNYFVDDRLETCCYLWKKGIHAILFKTVLNRVFVDVVRKRYKYFPSVINDWNELEILLKTIL